MVAGLRLSIKLYVSMNWFRYTVLKHAQDQSYPVPKKFKPSDFN